MEHQVQAEHAESAVAGRPAGPSVARAGALAVAAPFARRALLARHPPRERAALARTLSRTVGNRALTRALRPVLARAPKRSQPWESATLAPQVYNLADRDRLLRLFIAMFRQIELVHASADARRGAYEAIVPAIQTAADAIDPKSKNAADRQRLAQLKAMLAAGKGSPERMAQVVAEWESTSLAADRVMGEVTRLFSTGEVPTWLQSLVPWFAGMKYKSAHSSWYSARHLVYVIEWVKAETAAKAANPKVKAPKVVVDPALLSEVKALSEDAALQRLRDMRTRNEIPDAAWAKVVSLSSLRLDAEGPAAATVPESALEDEAWKRILSQWQAGQPPAPWIGEVGSRSWLTALKGGDVVFLQTVCNQLAEAAAAKRGISLPSGITQNADFFFNQVGKATSPVTPPPGKVAVAPYFRHAKGADDLRPGANLFFVDSPWVKEKPGAHAWVTYRPGHDYPLANDPDVKKTDPGFRKEWFKDTLPTDGAEHDGWTYNLVAGQPISRTHSDGRVQWLKWLHQATVMSRLGNRVFTLETVTGGSGFRERSVASLMASDVFVGWLPGSDIQYEDAPAAPAGAAETDEPASAGPEAPLPEPVPAG